ncbi:Uncharacterised protein [Segatella copri]|nr:Uncharacterised protein [Segatella copri]
MLFIGIIKEKDGTEQSTLAYSLCADEMHISIQTHFRITDVCAIHEYDFT